MPRKYKKTGKKKTLKPSNIFSKKSAKSQAGQIYALNKKVNAIQKSTAPEIKTYSQVLFYFDNYDSNAEACLREHHHRYELYEDRIFNDNLQRYLRLDGDLLRVKNIYLYGYFGLKDWTVFESGTPQPDLQAVKDAYLKITVAKVVKGGQGYPNQLTTTLTDLSNGQDPACRNGVGFECINGTLTKNITSQLQILKKKVVKISPTKPSKMIKIKLFNSKKVNLNYRKTVQGAYSQSEIFIYVDFLAPVALYNDTTQKYISPRCVAQLNYKIAYADDGTEEVIV